MLRLACNRGACQLRRSLNDPSAVISRSFWLRPWCDPRPLAFPSDRWVRQVEREMDRVFDVFLDRRYGPSCILGREVPVEVAGDGRRSFSLKVDVSKFAPEEVRVTVRNGLLTVRARHQETVKDGGREYREYVSEYALPGEVNEESIRSVLGKDGLLTIEASLPAAEATEETEIPIEKPAGKTDDSAQKKST